MIVTQNTKLNVIPGGIIPVVHVSQFDTGREISFTLYDGNAPAVLNSETVVTIEGTKPDGHGFSYEGTLVNNVVTFETTEQMTVLTGGIECKLKLVLGSQVIGTAMFILDVEKAGINNETIISDTEIPLIISLATEQMENAEAWAVGTKNGEPVSPTDPQYNNDAKHWAEEAAAAVSGVAGVKGNAEEEYRHGNVNLTPEDLGAVSWENQSELGAVNMLPYPYYNTSRTVSGVTFTDNGDGTITVNTASGGATADVSHNLSLRIAEQNILLKVGNSYTLSGCPDGGSPNTYFITLNKTKNNASDVIANEYGEGATFTLSEASEQSYGCYITIKSGTVCNNLVFKPMIALASYTGDYVPYAMTNKELTDKLLSKDQKTLTSSDDLNNITEAGVYGYGSSAPANSPENVSYAILYHIKTGGANEQQYVFKATASSYSNIYMRALASTSPRTWGSWFKIAGTVIS